MLELRFSEESAIGDAVLWRYMDFTKFVSLVERQALYFPRLDRLGDPFEGYTLAKFYELGLPGTEEFSRADKELLHKITTSSFRESAYVSCWHSSEHESAAMWNLYSRGLDTIAVKTSGHALAGCFGELCSERLAIGRVQYLDYERGFAKSDDQLFHFFMKRREFAHEKEVRIIYEFDPVDEFISFASSNGGNPGGVNVDVDLSTLIESVVVDPFAEEWFAELVRAVADRYGIGERVVPSSLADPPDWFSLADPPDWFSL